MSVLIEGINVVVRIDAVETKVQGGVQALLDHPPNQTLCADPHLLRAGFIDPDEAEAWVEALQTLGLAIEGPVGFEDLAIVDQVHGLPLPCAWLEFGGAPGEPTSAWLCGTPRGDLVVPEHWTFAHSLSRRFGRTAAAPDHDRLEFLRMEDAVGVYRDRENGQLVFLARAGAQPAFPAFEPIDHTADLAYVARGRTFEELFANAARGLFAFLIDTTTVERREQDRIEVEGADREECLVAFLQELIFREEVEKRLYADFDVTEAGPLRVVAVAHGESLDPTRHELKTDVKAATYHDLRFEQEASPEGPLYRVRIVLDI